MGNWSVNCEIARQDGLVQNLFSVGCNRGCIALAHPALRDISTSMYKKPLVW